MDEKEVVADESAWARALVGQTILHVQTAVVGRVIALHERGTLRGLPEAGVLELEPAPGEPRGHCFVASGPALFVPIDDGAIEWANQMHVALGQQLNFWMVDAAGREIPPKICALLLISSVTNQLRAVSAVTGAPMPSVRG